jgi:hypothetical protein
VAQWRGKHSQGVSTGHSRKSGQRPTSERRARRLSRWPTLCRGLHDLRALLARPQSKIAKKATKAIFVVQSRASGIEKAAARAGRATSTRTTAHCVIRGPKASPRQAVSAGSARLARIVSIDSSNSRRLTRFSAPYKVRLPLASASRREARYRRCLREEPPDGHGQRLPLPA